MVHCTFYYGFDFIAGLAGQEILQYENLDLENIITPVRAEVFRNLLIALGYDSTKTEFLYKGFSEGFELHHKGNVKVQKKAPNLKLRVGNKIELWNKVMKEVKEGRYAGPFKEIPYDYFIQSPIGLVPKDHGIKTRWNISQCQHTKR